MAEWLNKLKEKWKGLPKLIRVILVIAILACGWLPVIFNYQTTVTPPTPSVAGVSSSNLWVNGFNEEYTGWTRTGSSPWLDAQDIGYKGLEGFNYRKNITIAGSNSGTVSNYAVKLILHYGSGTDSGNEIYLNNHSQQDFDDIRFTTNSSLNLLDYWIEELNSGSNCTVWVEVPSIPSGGSTICIYYDNAAATSASSGTNTFPFFEDFESYNTGALSGQDGWSGDSLPEISTANPYEGSQNLQGDGSSSGSTSKGSLTLPLDGKIIFRLKKLYNGNHNWLKLKSGSEDVLGISAHSTSTSVSLYFSYLQSDDTWYDDTSKDWGSTYRKCEVAYNSSHYLYVKVDGTTWLSDTAHVSTSSIDTIEFRDNGALSYVAWDLVIIRKYVDPEPSVSGTSAEESNTLGNYVYSSDTSNDQIGNFTFQDLPSDATSLVNVTLYVYVKTTYAGGDYGVYCYIYNGTDWILEDSAYSSSSDSYEWFTITVDSLDTIEKVNNAQLYLKTLLASGDKNVDAAYLKVYYSSDPVPSSISYSTSTIGSECSFSTKWYAPNGLSHWIFSYNFHWNGSNFEWENETYQFSGNPIEAWTNLTKHLPMEIDFQVQWKIYANDTSGNMEVTSLQQFQTTEFDYSTESELQVDSEFTDQDTCGWNYVTQTDFIVTSFTAQWINRTFSPIAARYVKFYEMHTGYANNYIQGYEVNVKTQNGWESPSSVSDVCGADSGYSASNLTDGNLDSYWEHDVDENHWVIFDLGNIKNVSGVSWYFKGEVNQKANITSLKIDVFASFFLTGSSPYVNSTDYPNNYISANYTKQKIIFNFTQTNFQVILNENVTLNINYSSTGRKVTVYRDAGSWGWLETGTLQQTNGFELKSINISGVNLAGSNAESQPDYHKFYSPYYLNQLRLKLETDSSNGEVKIDFMKITFSGFDNISKEINWIFDGQVKRMVNDTFPLVYSYSEGDKILKDYATPSLIYGVYLYNYYENETYLEYAEKYFNWLQNQPICRLWQNYNFTSNSWEPELLSIDSSALRLASLASLASGNSSYQTLLQNAIDNFTAIFKHPQENDASKVHFINKAYVNGSYPSDVTLSLQSTTKAWAAVAYIGYILGNNTIKSWALNASLSYPIASTGIPYTYVELSTGSGSDVAKCDQHYGHFLLGLTSVYRYTEDSSLKDRIKTVAEASQYFFNDTYDYFYYRVYVNGTVASDDAVHGFGYVEEALVQSYLIWGNSTWLTYAKKDWNSMVAVGRIRRNDLICHAADVELDTITNSESNDYWNSHAKRMAVIFYNLNETGIYHNITYLNYYNRLIASTASNHKGRISWIQSIEGLKLNKTYYGGNEINFALIFKNIINTTKTINNLRDLYAAVGSPWIVYRKSTALSTGWNQLTTPWTIDIGQTLGAVNASLHTDNINFTTITFEYSNGTEISLYWEQTSNEYWVEDSTMTVTSDTTIWIYCKEEGEWYHTYAS